METSTFAQISTAEKNELPDSAFAVILPGGKKDESGKTIPRSLRKLPMHDKMHALAAKQALEGARGGVNLPEALRAKALRRVNAALKKHEYAMEKMPKKGEVMMSDISQIKNEKVSIFSEPLVNKVNELLGKIEISGTLEEAKGYATQIKVVLSEDVMEEPKQEITPEVKTEVVPEQASIIESQKVESGKMAESQLKDVAEYVKFSDTLVNTLKEAKSHIEALEVINAQLKAQIAEKDQTISKFQSQMEQERVSKFNSKRQEVVNQWITTFGLKQEDTDNVLKLLSSFDSEDKLAKVSNYLNLKAPEVKDEPQAITKPSSVLEITEIDASTMTKDQYMEHLFQKFKNSN